MDDLDELGMALRRDLRRFLHDEIARGSFDPREGSWARFDPAFAARLGARGYIGVDWPRAQGGGDGILLDRQIIAEELLAHGAPVRAHWAAEFLAAPLLRRLGTAAQQQELLPRIAAGRMSLCIGVAEDAVSPEPAAMLTEALPFGRGWRISGRKFPVADGARAQRMLLLARTAPVTEDRLAGLTLFLVDLALPGITARPCPDLAGGDAMAEVVLDHVFLAEDRIIGAAGDGLPAWLETAAAALGTPDGGLRCWPLLTGLVDALETGLAEAETTLGRLVAEAFTLQAMGLELAGRAAPPAEAALLALLAAEHAETIPAAVRRLLPEDRPEPLERGLLAAAGAAAQVPRPGILQRLALSGLRPGRLGP